MHRSFNFVKQNICEYIIVQYSTELLLGSQKPVKYPVKHPVKYREVMTREACETPRENMCEIQMLLWE